MALFDPLDANKAFINARYKDGKFIDLDTDSPVLLKGTPIVKITVDQSGLPTKELLALHRRYESRNVLGSGTELEFTLQGTGMRFTLVLHDDLILTKKGNKKPVAENLRIGIVSMIETNRGTSGPAETFEDWQVNSLNQAYFQISVKYKPLALSHSANVYQHFHLKGDYAKTLDTMRKF